MTKYSETWLTQLKQDPWFKAQGIQWLQPQASKKATQEMHNLYKGQHLPWGINLFKNAQVHLALEQAQKFRVVAQGPQVHRHFYQFTVEHPPLLLVHSNHPQQLFFSMGPSCPSFLFFPLGGTQEEIAQAWSQFFPVPHPSRLELPLVTRGWFAWGTFEVPNVYSGTQNLDIHNLSRIFPLGPFVDQTQWGSAHLEDPFNRPESKEEPPEHLPEIALAFFKHNGLDTLAQDEDSVFKETYRSKYSRSQISIEVHPDCIGLDNAYVFEIRHPPNPYPEVVEALNEKSDTSYPTNLPLDVIGILMGFNFFTKKQLLELLEQQTTSEAIEEVLSMLIPLMYDDIGIQTILRPYLKHESLDVRGVIYDLSNKYNLRYLLEEACFTEPDPEIIKILTQNAQLDQIPNKLHEIWEDEDEDIST